MSWEPVYRLVKKIPRGRVTTYGEVARALRLPGGARAVGYAMAATPSGRGIPWHRVLGAGGHIRVPERYEMIQRKLLQTEGVATDSAIIDLRKYGWSPLSRATKVKKRPRAKASTKRR